MSASDCESNIQAGAVPLQTPLKSEAVNNLSSPEDIKATATAKKADLQHNYQIIAVVSTLLAAIASTLLTPISTQSSYRRYASTTDQTAVSLNDLSNRLLAACYTSLILSIEATCLVCYLKYRLSTLSHEEICRTWKHAHIKLEKTAKHCFANYEVRALSVIFWFCFTSAILLMLGTILVYMYWQLPPVWFYVWSSFSGILLIIFIPLLTLRLYRTVTGTDLIPS